MNEQLVGIASKMYEARRSMRRITGGAYAKQVLNWMHGVKAVAKATQQSEAHACLLMLQGKSCDGFTMLWILAATVELIEPDAETPSMEEPGVALTAGQGRSVT